MITMENAKECLALVQAIADGKPIEFFDRYNFWVATSEIDLFSYDASRYRVMPEKLAPAKVPLTAEDIPALCWLRKEGLFIHHLVTSIDVEGIESSFGWISFLGLKDDRYKYSTDRKTWLPCWKEVAQ